MNRDFKFRAYREYYNDLINLVIFGKQGEKHVALSNLVFEELKEFSDPKEKIYMTQQQGQELMDSLWDCGIRPSEGTGSAGAMSAIQDHLKSMKILSDRLLSIVEKVKHV
jgi:hypothetical protein